MDFDDLIDEELNQKKPIPSKKLPNNDQWGSDPIKAPKLAKKNSDWDVDDDEEEADFYEAPQSVTTRVTTNSISAKQVPINKSHTQNHQSTRKDDDDDWGTNSTSNTTVPI